MTYLPLYVDDMLLASKDIDEIIKIKDSLSLEFDMKDLGPAKRILGMDIKRDRYKGFLFLNQKMYIEKVLQRFNMNKKQNYIYSTWTTLQVVKLLVSQHR